MRASIWFLAVTACTSTPTATGAQCPQPDPLTMGYDTAFDPQCTPTSGTDCFGKSFMDKYCIQCHDSHLPISKRNGAPLLHDYDTLEGVLEVPEHIDEYTGIGPDAANHFMPLAGCPSTPGGPIDTKCAQPTDDERRQLAVWLDCAKARHYNFRPDAGVPDAAPADGPPAD